MDGVRRERGSRREDLDLREIQLRQRCGVCHQEGHNRRCCPISRGASTSGERRLDFRMALCALKFSYCFVLVLCLQFSLQGTWTAFNQYKIVHDDSHIKVQQDQFYSFLLAITVKSSRLIL
ncbi:hypothetical protein CFP56_012341 [Quercus suber]|uniref:Uncharacterized protein n=1 Tax=Quercus suber TaxID=58331 RepID=A0AAW0M4M4_QUESU